MSRTWQICCAQCLNNRFCCKSVALTRSTKAQRALRSICSQRSIRRTFPRRVQNLLWPHPKIYSRKAITEKIPSENYFCIYCVRLLRPPGCASLSLLRKRTAAGKMNFVRSQLKFLGGGFFLEPTLASPSALSFPKIL